jgi:hypothetical protein
MKLGIGEDILKAIEYVITFTMKFDYYRNVEAKYVNK